MSGIDESAAECTARTTRFFAALRISGRGRWLWYFDTSYLKRGHSVLWRFHLDRRGGRMKVASVRDVIVAKWSLARCRWTRSAPQSLRKLS